MKDWLTFLFFNCRYKSFKISDRIVKTDANFKNSTMTCCWNLQYNFLLPQVFTSIFTKWFLNAQSFIGGVSISIVLLFSYEWTAAFISPNEEVDRARSPAWLETDFRISCQTDSMTTGTTKSQNITSLSITAHWHWQPTDIDTICQDNRKSITNQLVLQTL